MKSSKAGSRRTASNLSESIHQHLNMYAIAAGAAGLSLFALAPRAEAKIVYTRANTTIFNDLVILDLNHDGIPDFGLCIHDRFFSACTLPHSPRGGQRVKLLVLPPKAESQENRILQTHAGFAAALRFGFDIGPERKFHAGSHVMASWSFGSGKTYSYGPWANVQHRYLGLKFIINGRTHYGWARLNASVNGATLTGYAYETIPNKAIIAGKTHGPADDWDGEDFSPGASLTSPIPDKPQPASLGMLALGAQGVPLWRRRESIGGASENNPVSAFQ